MALDKTTRAIVREAQQRGWELLPQRPSNHIIMRWKGGGPQVVTASTPSDRRGPLNFEAQLRRIERNHPA